MNPVAAFLVDGTLKGTCVLAVAWMATLTLRRRSAAVRHLVWVSAFAAILAMPVLQAAVPWRLPLPALTFARPSVEGAVSTVENPPRLAANAFTGTLTPPALRRPGTPHASLAIPAPAMRPDLQPMLTRLLAGLVLAGSAMGLLRAFVAAISLWRIRRFRSRPAGLPSDAQTALSRAARLRRAWDLRVAASPLVPAALTWGVLRPVVLLPSGSEQWTEYRRSLVLLHELAHVRRLDFLTRLLSVLVGAVYWFNPAIWLAARCLRAEAERAADDAVLRAGVTPSAYAAELVDIAAGVARRRPPLFPFTVNPIGVSVMNESKIESRIRAILHPSTTRARRGATGLEALAIAAFASVAVVPLAVTHAAEPTSIQKKTAPHLPAPFSKTYYVTVSRTGRVTVVRSAHPKGRILAVVHREGRGPDHVTIETRTPLTPTKRSDAVWVTTDSVRAGNPPRFDVLARTIREDRVSGIRTMHLSGDSTITISNVEALKGLTVAGDQGKDVRIEMLGAPRTLTTDGPPVLQLQSADSTQVRALSGDQIRQLVGSGLMTKDAGKGVSEVMILQGDDPARGKDKATMRSRALKTQVDSLVGAQAGLKLLGEPTTTIQVIQDPQPDLGKWMVDKKALNSVEYEVYQLSAQEKLQRAQAELALAQSEFDRRKKLHDQGAFSQMELDVAQAKLDVARAKLTLAQKLLDLYRSKH